MKIQFLGAAKNVTGSRFFLESKRSRVLIDCGLYQERDFRARNWKKFPVKPSSIKHVLLTHAHIDHCGYIPKLIKEGFKGRIFCTSPTAEIAEIALFDSARLQEADAAHKKKRHKKEKRKGPYPEIPLYTEKDVRKVYHRFKTVLENKPIKITNNIQAIFHDAGHILGSSMIELRITEAGKEKIGIFSGDIGRWDRPILRDPTVIEQADFVLMETTYGDRVHEGEASCYKRLQQVINETHARGGNVIVPTFSIGRAQELIYCIGQLIRQKKIPPLLCFMDSPMAIDVTRIFRKYPQFYDQEAKGFYDKGEALFNFPLLKNTPSVSESKAINNVKSGVIIMAGSGMCTGGRIKHHLANNISRAKNTILFVGYQAFGTLGREILEGAKRVRILGQNYSVKARVEKINSFSAHADKGELLRWILSFKKKPKDIFLVHGEEKAAFAFAQVLKKQVKSKILIPEYLQECVL